jgi:uncharacterized protein (TIGR03000 family)
MLRTTFSIAAAALLTTALPANAWQPWWGYTGGFGPGPYPPSYYGYPLADHSAAYYGGINYREYYAFGHGIPNSVADFPGPLPGPIYPYGYRPPAPHAHDVTPEAAPVFVPEPGCALIDMTVPANAVVLLDGEPTRQTGASRQFVSPPLKSGKDYHYELRVRWNDNGRDVEESRQVTVHADERVNVAFPAVVATEKVSAPRALAPELSR